jgi:hypothetical protein
MGLTPLNSDDDARKLTRVRQDDSTDIWDIFAEEKTGNSGRSLIAQAQEVRAATAVPAGKRLRRLIFMWLRIYVFEVKYGKTQRVNIAIPIPIPLLGALFGGQMPLERALKVAQMAEDTDEADLAAGYLESTMGLEMIRVDQVDDDKQKQQLVVIGLD